MIAVSGIPRSRVLTARARMSVDIPRPNYKLVDSLRIYEDLVRSVCTSEIVSFDYETSEDTNERFLLINDAKKRPLDKLRSTITSASFRTTDGNCYYLSCDHRDSFNMPESAVRDVFEAKKHSNLQAPILAHNYGFEWTISRLRLGIDLRDYGPMEDTMLMAYVLDTNSQTGLKYLSRYCLGIIQQSYEDVTFGKTKKMNELTAAHTLHYGCDDSELTLELYYLFKKALDNLGLYGYYQSIEMPIAPIIAEMSLEGAHVDLNKLYRRQEEDQVKMQDLQSQIWGIAGWDTKLSSPIQVSKLLYETCGIARPPYASSASATDAESLYWIINEHEVVRKLIEYRKLETRNKLYYKPYPFLIHPDDERLHSELRQNVADTSRFASGSPNLQQLAKRGDGAVVRELFYAPLEEEGLDLVGSADMSQVELVLAGHRSQSKVMMEAYGPKRGDLHTATCMAVFHISAEEAKANKTFRSSGKTTNFTLIYGGMAKRVYRQIKLDLAKMGMACPFTLHDVEVMIMRYYGLYPEVRDMQMNDVRFARQHGYVVSLYGRRFYLPNINSRNSLDRSKAERKATNSPIQGSCAELLKLAIIKINKERIPKDIARIWTLIHDEAAFYANSKYKRDVAHVINKHMAHTPKGLRTYMASEVKFGKDFKNMTEYTEHLEKEVVVYGWNQQA